MQSESLLTMRAVRDCLCLFLGSNAQGAFIVHKPQNSIFKMTKIQEKQEKDDETSSNSKGSYKIPPW